MRYFLFFLLVLTYFSCSKKDSPAPTTVVAQNTSVLVAAVKTDPNYSANEESHYIVRNNVTHLNKLLLFMGGSYSAPKDYNLICDYGATIGLDVISLSYPNDIAAAPLGTSADFYIFDNYRDEICFGNPVSNLVAVNSLNSILNRATKLVIYLKNTYPDQNWGQYLTTSNNLDWAKIIVAGHSQGSGHACYLAKKFLVNRVVMLSGPNDYSSYYSGAGNWLTVAGSTPLDRHYALLHTQDEIVPFNFQVVNLKGLGLLTSSQSPTLADRLTSPYANAHVLSLNIPAISYHSSTVGANSVLPGIWTYMFTY